jgi:hypothetical protein
MIRQFVAGLVEKAESIFNGSPIHHHFTAFSILGSGWFVGNFHVMEWMRGWIAFETLKNCRFLDCVESGVC